MKAKISQYLNEIIGITIMLLMAIALVAAQDSAGSLVRESGAGNSAAIAIIDTE